MIEKLKLMCILAHPDDETLGTGSTLVKYAAEGVEIVVVSATRGERGWNGDDRDFPGLEALGKIRENELLCAPRTLVVRKGEANWPVTWEAVNCHKSQLPGFGDMSRITKAQHRQLWGRRTYYWVYSPVNSGRIVETDLFSGLR